MVVIGILKVNGTYHFLGLIIRFCELLGSAKPISVMACSGLRWIWIEDIKSNGKELADVGRRGRAKEIRTVRDAGKGSSYDVAHAVMEHAINWFKQ